MNEFIDPRILQRIRDDFQGSNARQFKRDFTRTYYYKGQKKTRPIQFLSPKLFVTVPHIEVTGSKTSVKVSIENNGDTSCYNIVAKLLVNTEDGQNLQSPDLKNSRYIIPIISSGQKIDKSFDTNPQVSRTLKNYRVIVFDPCFDPIASSDIPNLIPKNYHPSYLLFRGDASILNSILSSLLRAGLPEDQVYNIVQTTKSLGGLGSVYGWGSRKLDRSYRPLTSGSRYSVWNVRIGDLPELPRRPRNVSDFFFLSSYEKETISELSTSRKISYWMDRDSVFIERRDELLINTGGWVLMNGNPRRATASIGLDFLDSSRNQIGNSKIFPAGNPAISGRWQPWWFSVSIPSGTEEIVLRLICDRRYAREQAVYFQPTYFYPSHRQVFVGDNLIR